MPQDRKTVRRYVEAAQAAGLCRDSGEGQPEKDEWAVVDVVDVAGAWTDDTLTL